MTEEKPEGKAAVAGTESRRSFLKRGAWAAGAGGLFGGAVGGLLGASEGYKLYAEERDKALAKIEAKARETVNEAVKAGAIKTPDEIIDTYNKSITLLTENPQLLMEHPKTLWGQLTIGAVTGATFLGAMGALITGGIFVPPMSEEEKRIEQACASR